MKLIVYIAHMVSALHMALHKFHSHAPLSQTVAKPHFMLPSTFTRKLGLYLYTGINFVYAGMQLFHGKV